MQSIGIVLAAGEGRRFGRPKALVPGWLDRAVGALDPSCDRTVVVLGASAGKARALVPGSTSVVVAEDWADGQSASLRAGLAHAVRSAADVAVIHLVDLPDVGADVVRRVLAGAGRATLARAVFDGRPGHPVVIGRDHWAGVLTTATGDDGARAYLSTRDVARVECADLATGRDVDEDPTRDQPTAE